MQLKFTLSSTPSKNISLLFEFRRDFERAFKQPFTVFCVYVLYSLQCSMYTSLDAILFYSEICFINSVFESVFITMHSAGSSPPVPWPTKLLVSFLQLIHQCRHYLLDLHVEFVSCRTAFGHQCCETYMVFFSVSSEFVPASIGIFRLLGSSV